MSLRVITGSAKGRRLKVVPGDSTRAITDRVKESLFNILGSDIKGAIFWDLFGGTGAVGIEALSRGAAFVYFLDHSWDAIKTIRSNLEHTHLTDHAEIRHGDSFTLLAKPPDRKFDYIYIAPPQYQELWLKALRALDDNPGWMNENAWVIVQVHPREYQSLSLQNLNEFDQRKYGSTLLIFYEKKTSG